MGVGGLPISIQDFRKLRQGGYTYVDKTRQLHAMAHLGTAQFLSRPRRFGKSLLVSTLEELFLGNKALFEGLWIENNWDWSQRHPVLKIGFSSIGYGSIGLEAAIVATLNELAASYGVSLAHEQGIERMLRRLIITLAEQHKPVVLLIDEYDKPIIDYLDDLPQAEANRNTLKRFYSVLKDLDRHLRLVFLTGVSKFSRVSIFSELNNLIDLTLHPKFGDLVGYTQQEIEHYFEAYINEAAPAHGGREALLHQMGVWYNGYSWTGTHRVYNPWSILNFFSEGLFRNFWFDSGTPTFLTKLLNKHHLYDVEGEEVAEAAFSSFELGDIDLHALLFQTGYITIKKQLGQNEYEVGYPNQEVRQSFLIYLLAESSGYFPSKTGPYANKVAKALKAHNPEAFVAALNVLFAKIPHQLFIANKEAYYHSITFLALSLAGVYAEAETSMAQGRADCIIKLPTHTYIIEFKLDQSAATALAQIKANNYAGPYTNSPNPVYLLGINFSSAQKAITGYQLEALPTPV